MSERKANLGSPATRGDIVLYPLRDGSAALEVRLARESVWLTQSQMAALFGKDSDTIGLHVRNVFKERELSVSATTEDSSVVRVEGGRTVQRRLRLHNLDVIISVGYRVRSKRGTQFRIWATRVLRDHITKGYSVNERRLAELNRAVRLIADVAGRQVLTGDEATGLLRVVADYSRALDLLDDYDHQRVAITGATHGPAVPMTLEEARQAVERLRRQYDASDLFGRERDKSLESALVTAFQTFDGRDLYPSLEEKAAQLLYLLVKNHPFVDGNKRIAAALFLWFLDKNGALYRSDRQKRLADTALVAVTLLIAESKPAQKGLLTRLVANLLVPAGE